MAARRAMTGAAAVARAAPFMAMAVALFLCSASASAETVDCSAQFNAMQPCIEFVNSNDINAPSQQCCTAFKATEINTPVCLCQLQQAFADPATAPGNVTRANQIPSLCAVKVNPSRCPALLGLAPAIPPRAATPPTPTGADVDCSPEFDSLSICIAYVSSNDPTPPAACCTSLLDVHLKKPVCLCQLLQQVNGDPSLTSGLNVTKALDLPNVCKVKTNADSCSALLGQPVASPLPAMGPGSAPAPEAGAPGIIVDTPVATPDASPAVTAPSGSGANPVFGVTAPLVMLVGFVASSLNFLL